MSVISKTSKHFKTLSRNYRCSNNVARYPNLQPMSLLRSSINGIITRSISLNRNLLANVSFNLTDIGEGIKEVQVKEWFVKVGDTVSQFDNICEVQSDKASVTITSRYDGVITKLHYDVDAIALVGKPLVDVETEAASNDTPRTPKESIVPEKPAISSTTKLEESKPDSYKKKLCVPSVRRLTKENNINLKDLTGTGKDGRILKEDVLKFLEKSKPPIKTVSSVATHKPDKIEPIRGFKKAMLKTMTESLKIPHFLYHEEVKVTQLSKIRKSLKEYAEKDGVKLSFLPFFIKAASNALHKYPILNSSLDASCENIIYKSSHNIAVAMQTEVGLAVPVVKGVENLTLLEIAKELNRLMVNGKKGNFSPEDLSGGTFALSNIGVIGGTVTMPIVLAPQVSILGIGELKVLPRFDSSMNVIAEQIINVSAVSDHRIIDGVTIAEFIKILKAQLENPYLLLL